MACGCGDGESKGYVFERPSGSPYEWNQNKYDSSPVSGRFGYTMRYSDSGRF
ncbi:hypothetical protein HOA55_02740 [archaeon]|nr:hypothetical protein [archaeon]MBT3577237.1 hypothetical protein [archaeon]MBT6820246.1 hypothetical protein [archaeon]MBT6956723.1 hypothetical protein [archaeon]MBT7025450.1 hypothetical protein [archaeon]